MDRSSNLALRIAAALPSVCTAASSLSARRLGRARHAVSTASSYESSHLAASARSLHTSPSNSATPLPHPTVPGPPPSPPQQSATQPADRLSRKRQQAELFLQNQHKPTNPAKPSSALQKRFWKDVSVVETDSGLQIHLDTRPVRTATRQTLTLPHSRRALAAAIALEWDHLVSAQQAVKHHYIPLTSSTSRALDIAAADAASAANPGTPNKVRDDITTIMLRYLGTDTLLCWAPEVNIHDPESQNPSVKGLRQMQREVAEPIIAYLTTHVFPGVAITPTLDSTSIRPTPQPEGTREVIRGWIAGLPAFELAALERGVLATKSLLVAARMVVEWSQEFRGVGEGGEGERFGIEEASRAASLEVLHQTERWGEVEDTHDVENADIRRQLGTAVLLVS